LIRLSPYSLGSSQQQQQQQKPVEDLPAEVHQVKTQEDFEKHCISRAGSCLIAFLDTEEEEGQRKDRDLKMLKELAEKFKKSFHFVWLDGIKNIELADTLGTTILPSVRYTTPFMPSCLPSLTVFLFTVFTIMGRKPTYH
jgi:hypothetical protein